MKTPKPSRLVLSCLRPGAARLAYERCVGECGRMLTMGKDLCKALPLVEGNDDACRAVVSKLLSMTSYMEKKFLKYECGLADDGPLWRAWRELKIAMFMVDVNHRLPVDMAMKHLKGRHCSKWKDLDSRVAQR